MQWPVSLGQKPQIGSTKAERHDKPTETKQCHDGGSYGKSKIQSKYIFVVPM